MKFEIGDVVRLKSGGPLMTVTWAGETEVACQWFTSNTASASLRESFLTEVLEKID